MLMIIIKHKSLNHNKVSMNKLKCQESESFQKSYSQSQITLLLCYCMNTQNMREQNNNKNT